MIKLRIKNMVCPRCIEAVEEELQHLGFNPAKVTLGEAILEEQASIAQDKKNRLKTNLAARGFDLIEPDSGWYATAVKAALLHYLKRVEENKAPEKLSAFISKELQRHYGHISEQYKNEAGKTIEKTLIEFRAERAKELLTSNSTGLSVSEIALQLGYSSSQHFSAQFRKYTGKSPGEWRKNPGDRVSRELI
ncbi:MAG: helix-turn-helix domain-containing protein [Balneolales bacterium]|nr:helix-turn-helix domain-containing protein [Balneolales bacterium]